MGLGGNRQMGRSLDRGQVLALSLWDDVEVNMLWLDSAFPLDKPTTSPGIRRGTCPGGESSTPTYVRNTYPDGYVLFANAAIGEIGSTLLGSTGPFPTTPPPPCVEQCSSKPGQNTPECSGQTKVRCQQMAQYENKCQWTECPSTSSSTVPPTTTSSSATTTSLAPSTSSESMCELDRNMKACVSQGGSFKCQRCRNDTYHYNKLPNSRRMQILVRNQHEKLGEEMPVDKVCWMLFMFYKVAPGK